MKNLFGNNSSNQDDIDQTAIAQTEPSPVEKPTEQIPPKKILLRGSGGKFVSPDKIAVSTKEKKVVEVETIPQLEKPAAEVKTAVIESLNEPSVKEDDQQMVSTFYGASIRKFYLEKQWYFALEDILPLAQYNNPHKALERLEENIEFKKVFDAVSETIEGTACVTYVGFMELLPLLRGQEHVFPGPFPDWLKDTAEIPNQ